MWITNGGWRSPLSSFAIGTLAGLGFLLVELLARVVVGVPTLSELVQDRVLMLLPGPVFALVLERLLYLGKPLFFVGLLVLQLVLLGLGGLAKPGGWWAFAFAGLLWLLVGGSLAPLTSKGFYAGDPRVGVTCLAAFAAYGLILWLSRPRAVATSYLPTYRRRALLAGGTLLLASGVLTQRLIAGMIGGRVAADAQVSPAQVPQSLAGVSIPPGLPPPITQADAFYIVSKNLADPVVDAGTWRLRVTGLVDQPLELSLDALMLLPAVQVTRTLECISNEVGGDLMSTGVWTGLRMADLLQRAGVQSAATSLVFRSVDGYSETMALDRAQDPQTLLAYALNAQPLPAKHGFPLRVLSSGTYGMKNPKWLTQVDVVATAEPGFWEQQGWNPDAPVQTMARIDAPRDGETVTARTLIRGVAFAADRGIQRVEVSTDAGNSWSTAELLPSLGPSTWSFWQLGWQPPAAGSATLVARAFDGAGQPQTDRRADSFPSGSSGYHSINVRVA